MSARSEKSMGAKRNIGCPHCAATNRVPIDKPAREARCGGCHRPVFDGHPAAVDGARFAKHRASNDIAVLVDVWAPWCGPCRAMAPMFERAAKELEPNVRLLKLNSDAAPTTSSRLGITGIPTLLLMRGGREIARRSGAMDARNIVAWARAE